MHKRLLFLFLFSLSITLSLKVAVISDIHLSPLYNASTSQNWCWGNSSIPKNLTFFPKSQNSSLKGGSDPFAFYGRYGCDPGQVLLDTFLQKLTQEDADVDLVLITGDMVGHAISLKPSEVNENKYRFLKYILTVVAQKISLYFKKAVILPALGNNDCKYHYQVPFSLDDKLDYYSFLYEIFFNNIPANKKIINQDLQKTLMNGGYFRADITDSLTLLSFNTLYYNNGLNLSYNGPERKDQLNWLAHQLSEPNRKFIIFYHIYPGARYYQKSLVTWNQSFIEEYKNILERAGERVLIEVGGHDHYSDIRYHAYQSGHYRNLLIAPSLTLVDYQNPGVTVFEVNDGKAENLKMIFLEIQKTYNNESQKLPFFEVDFKKEFGLKRLDGVTMKKFAEKMERDSKLAQKFLMNKLGFEVGDPAQVQEAQAIYNNTMNLADLMGASYYKYSCQLSRSWSVEELDGCIAAKQRRILNKLKNKFLS